MHTKINFLFKTVLLLFFVTNLTYAQQGKFTGGEHHDMPQWFKQSFLDIAEDVEEAKEEDKHVILFMTLKFCPYCTKMINENFKEGAKHQEYMQEHFDVIGINIKGDKEIVLNEDKTMTEKEYAKFLKVQYTPTILFMNQENEIIVRLNGYRSPENFKLVLDFVKNRAYEKMSLTQYLDKVKNQTLYTLQPNRLFKNITDLSAINETLAVIFEDGSCTQCDYLHHTTLQNKAVKQELSKITVVRFDAMSNKKIITPNGKTTTPHKWAKQMLLDYRPGIILFDNKQEIVRIDALLYSFHFKELIRYVSGGYYKQFHTFLDYLKPRQKELLDSGINIDISDKY